MGLVATHAIWTYRAQKNVQDQVDALITMTMTLITTVGDAVDEKKFNSSSSSNEEKTIISVQRLTFATNESLLRMRSKRKKRRNLCV